jgi:hypothetical protein
LCVLHDYRRVLWSSRNGRNTTDCSVGRSFGAFVLGLLGRNGLTQGLGCRGGRRGRRCCWLASGNSECLYLTWRGHDLFVFTRLFFLVIALYAVRSGSGRRCLSACRAWFCWGRRVGAGSVCRIIVRRKCLRPTSLTLYINFFVLLGLRVCVVGARLF